MLRRQRTSVLLVALFVIGFLPEPALATHTRWALMKPPVGSADGDAHMNQGYHSPENGIDWDDEDGSGTCCGVGRNV